MSLDLVLDEAARHGQQSKPLDDGQRFDELEPGSLLRSQRTVEAVGIGMRGAVAGGVGFSVEFGDDVGPQRREISTGIIGQRRIPLFRTLSTCNG